jgi:hypothetical protein
MRSPAIWERAGKIGPVTAEIVQSIEEKQPAFGAFTFLRLYSVTLYHGAPLRLYRERGCDQLGRPTKGYDVVGGDFRWLQGVLARRAYEIPVQNTSNRPEFRPEYLTLSSIDLTSQRKTTSSCHARSPVVVQWGRFFAGARSPGERGSLRDRRQLSCRRSRVHKILCGFS